jgi:transcription elongation factor Elf1
MTTLEEMKRLTQSDTPYKTMSDIIEACLVTKLGMPVYDLCLGDYQFLLHKLRIVTYGPEYKMDVYCRNCGNTTTTTINLDSLTVREYDSSFDELKRVELPVSKKVIELRVQTPRILDEIALKTKEMKRKNKDLGYDPSILITLEKLIKTIDGVVPSSIQLENFVRKLPMRDVNILFHKAQELNGKVGLDNEVIAKCKECGYDVVTTFRITGEFFGPSID